MSGPSENALAESMARAQHTGSIREILDAAHDPALGLDRSVCLRDILAWLRTDDGPTVPGHEVLYTASVIEREFGGGA